jgi:hypothetical protein
MKRTKGTVPKNVIQCYAHGLYRDCETIEYEEGGRFMVLFSPYIVYWIDHELKYCQKLIASKEEIPRFKIVTTSSRKLRVELHGPGSYTIGIR